MAKEIKTKGNTNKSANTTNDEVKSGDKVTVHYTGKLSDGNMFDTSQGRAPLTFTAGAGQVIPGFDKAVDGMKVKDKKTFVIPAAEAYGPVIKELVLEIPRDKLPPQPDPQVGMQLMMKGPQGQQIPAQIVKVEPGKVTIDINHPLAGKDLHFDIEIMGINMEGTEEEEGGCCCEGEECSCSGGDCSKECDCACEDDECECEHKECEHTENKHEEAEHKHQK
ncbi:MAG: peptidylprolyl isomerase [Candidatus Woesearchaeota archaeon]